MVAHFRFSGEVAEGKDGGDTLRRQKARWTFGAREHYGSVDEGEDELWERFQFDFAESPAGQVGSGSQVVGSLHENRNFASRQILLVADIFVRSDEDFKSRFLRRIQQFAVLKDIPTSLRGGLHLMASKECADRSRSTLVEENQHQRPSVDDGA